MIAMKTPIMLTSVNWSPNTIADIEIVVTSLNIPAIDKGMIPALWMILSHQPFIPSSTQ